MRHVSSEIARRGHWLFLENPGDPVPDGDGGYTHSWAPLTPPNVWAAIAPASATDLQRLVASDAILGVATHVITMPFHPGVSLDTRVTWHRAPKRPDRFFQVQSVQNLDEREISLVLVCAEIVGATAPPQTMADEEVG